MFQRIPYDNSVKSPVWMAIFFLINNRHYETWIAKNELQTANSGRYSRQTIFGSGHNNKQTFWKEHHRKQNSSHYRKETFVGRSHFETQILLRHRKQNKPEAPPLSMRCKLAQLYGVYQLISMFAVEIKIFQIKSVQF